MIRHVAAGFFRRTDAERRDQELAWNRSDQAFFAAGACHILAWTFLETYPDAGFHLVDLRKVGEKDAFHVVASNGTDAFDHAGWTSLDELVRMSEEFEGVPIETLPVTEDSLHSYCQSHWCRPPEGYWSDPIPRAQAYLKQFPAAGSTAVLR
ncbi:hypothetical protein Kfla_0649 [Kribbella flavida DSM 17836]|uniref:Uncharacterized protein n=1 Tax=Kribbella flavida (strain DSM 17836 / JCM 10339 / NBRC 14399) TaxID=479435 RepID=D2PXC2_KRIFD|nr:hypothetical protein [Kribbella flavida]ADB29770.1 hypothetical protein Kfla_0649 [Kribbella flavida DSM 17836]